MTAPYPVTRVTNYNHNFGGLGAYFPIRRLQWRLRVSDSQTRFLSGPFPTINVPHGDMDDAWNAADTNMSNEWASKYPDAKNWAAMWPTAQPYAGALLPNIWYEEVDIRQEPPPSLNEDPNKTFIVNVFANGFVNLSHAHSSAAMHCGFPGVVDFQPAVTAAGSAQQEIATWILPAYCFAKQEESRWIDHADVTLKFNRPNVWPRGNEYVSDYTTTQWAEFKPIFPENAWELHHRRTVATAQVNGTKFVWGWAWANFERSGNRASGGWFQLDTHPADPIDPIGNDKVATEAFSDVLQRCLDGDYTVLYDWSGQDWPGSSEFDLEETVNFSFSGDMFNQRPPSPPPDDRIPLLFFALIPEPFTSGQIFGGRPQSANQYSPPPVSPKQNRLINYYSQSPGNFPRCMTWLNDLDFVRDDDVKIFDREGNDNNWWIQDPGIYSG